MSNVKILIVEDNHPFALDMELMIKELGHEQVTIVNNAEEALLQVKKEKPSIIITDVYLKGEMTGLQLAEKIKEAKIPFVFITSYDDDNLYVQAKKVNPVAFLVKPVEKLTLQSTIELAILRNSNTDITNIRSNFIIDDFIFVKNNNFLYKLLIRDILYVEIDGNYSVIHTPKKRHVVKISLSSLKEMLPNRQFFQIHRNFLVQCAMIDSINLSANEVAINSLTLPISRRYKEEFLETIQYLK